MYPGFEHKIYRLTGVSFLKKWIAGLLLIVVLICSNGCGNNPTGKTEGKVDNITVQANDNNTTQDDNKPTTKPEGSESTQNRVLKEATDLLTPAAQKTSHPEGEPTEPPVQEEEPPELDIPELYPVMKDDKWGYIDDKGDLQIDYVFEYAGVFSDGAASVRIDGKEGLIGPGGAFLIEPVYDSCGNISEGLAHVAIEENGRTKHGFADLSGGSFFKDYLNNNTGSFHDGLACFEQDNLFGYVNTSGDIVIEPVYQFAYDFSEGLAMVSDDMDRCGFINTKNELVIPMVFDHYCEESYRYQGFSNGLAAVSKDGKIGFIDIRGDYKIPARFDYAERFHDGLALVLVDGLWGYINESGDYAIEPQYQFASSFSNGYAFAKLPGVQADEADLFAEYSGFGLIDTKGEFITATNLYYEYGGGYTFAMEWIWGFIDDLARVIIEDEAGLHYVYINKDGNVVWQMK